MSDSKHNVLPVDQVPQTQPLQDQPLRTLDQVADAICADSATSLEYLEDSVVPFGGE